MITHLAARERVAALAISTVNEFLNELFGFHLGVKQLVQVWSWIVTRRQQSRGGPLLPIVLLFQNAVNGSTILRLMA